MALTFQRATRARVKLKIGVQGPSGSGKTLGALALARQLAGPEGRIAVIDTENDSASLYADREDFDTLAIRAPYLTSKFVDAVEAAVAAGYDVVVLDSISHQWDGDGGILQRKEEADTVPGSNHWTNWGPFTKETNRFRKLILESPVHIIATLRSKMAYTQTEAGSKKKVEKLGLQPIQRDGLEYEFSVTFELQMDHKAAASKDRTDLFRGQRVDLTSPKTGKALLEWLSSGAADALPVPSVPDTPESGASDRQPAAPITRDTPYPYGTKLKGMTLATAKDAVLVWMVAPERTLPEEWKEAAREELEHRREQAEAPAEPALAAAPKGYTGPATFDPEEASDDLPF